MELLRVSWEKGTTLTSRLIAYGNHKIEGLIDKLIPGFASRLTQINAMPPECLDGFGMHTSRGMAPCAPGAVTATVEVVD